MLKSLFALGIAATVSMMATAASDSSMRDVLDTPAVKSPLAVRALVNGLAIAGTRIVAVGQRGHVLLSDDAGKSWQQAEVPVSSDLVAVAFPSANTGWAVGHDGVVLHSTNAGGRWTRQLDGHRAGSVMVDYYSRETAGGDSKRAALLEEAKRFAAQGAESPLLDVWFENETTGFVVGAFGLILRTTDGGANWEPWLHAVDNPKSFHLYSIRGVAGDVYIVGEQGLVLKLDRTAGRFRALDLPYKGTLFGVIGNAHAVLVFGLRGTVLRSGDGGRSWQTVDTGLQVGLTSATVGDDGRIIIASQAGHVLASRDNGASFKAVQIERPIPAAAVISAAKDSIIVAGPRGVHSQSLR
jgi:photosystem II stability/assembly factor-like uncharacterized protein